MALNPLLAGTYAGPISFATNDADEPLFLFNVTGTMLATQILDDTFAPPAANAAGFRKFGLSGGWGTSAVGMGREADFSYTDPSLSAVQEHFATWTFLVSPGQYRVAATWPDQLGIGYASNVEFTVYDDDSLRGSAVVNQEAGPSGTEDQQSVWQDLGGVYNIGGRLVVRINALGAEGYIASDAVRVERIGDLPPDPDMVTTPQILDDGEPGYTHSGDFGSAPLSIARDGDTAYAVGGAAPGEATWTFTVTPGQYRVAATWFDTAGSIYFADNAPFTILDGDLTVANVAVNQRFAPRGFVDGGSRWEQLGGIVDMVGSTLTVRLTNVGANGYVLADAIRIERTGPALGNSARLAEAANHGGLSVAQPIDGTLRAEAPTASVLDHSLATDEWSDDLDEVAAALAARSRLRATDDSVSETVAVEPSHSDADVLDLAILELLA